jgi:hypothetical protein
MKNLREVGGQEGKIMIHQPTSSFKLFQIIKHKILQINDIKIYFDSRK